jgi:hypothetical protein
MKEVIRVAKARNGVHKFTAFFPDGPRVNFGRQGYSDYTIHKDSVRMMRYLTRHRKRENWGVRGARSAGFWSRWLLWSKPSLQSAARETEKALGFRYKIKFSTRNK